MTLTQKEKALLKDLQDQEKLCVTKYDNYSNSSCSTELKKLFKDMADTEREHLKSLSDLSGGTVDTVPETIGNSNNCSCGCASYKDEQSKTNDEFFLKDMLSTEKHTAELYNTCIFEFKDPEARKLLNHILSEEQQHGEQIYAYMASNGMYA